MLMDSRKVGAKYAISCGTVQQPQLGETCPNPQCESTSGKLQCNGRSLGHLVALISLQVFLQLLAHLSQGVRFRVSPGRWPQ